MMPILLELPVQKKHEHMISKSIIGSQSTTLTKSPTFMQSSNQLEIGTGDNLNSVFHENINVFGPAIGEGGCRHNKSNLPNQ